VKAIILAGGKGTRASPFTDFFPKTLIPVEGKPLISYIVNHLSSFRFIDEIIIVADFNGLGGQIKHYFENRKKGKKISFVQDSGRGTAGDLLPLSLKLKGSDFVLWFGDNLGSINIKKMYEVFKAKKSLACIATRSQRKEASGFAEIKNGIITKFKEKPWMELKISECLGIYILHRDVIKIIKSNRKKTKINLSFDVLQSLSKHGKVSAFDIGNTPWFDVESPKIVELNKKSIKRIIKKIG